MEKTLEEKKKLAAKVIAALKKEYPDADCTLDYNEAWKLLVSVRLAAQCTDARVNVVVQDLQKVSGCEGIGGSRCGRDRGDRPPLRPWKKQGPGHQRLHEDSLRAVSRKRTG